MSDTGSTNGSDEVELGIVGIEGAVAIGEGGFATVYRAEQPVYRRQVAVKVLNSSEVDEQARARFLRECAALGSLSEHPHIVTLYESGFTRTGKPFLIMAYTPGGTLQDRVDRDGPQPWADVLAVGVKLSGALESAHRVQVLHRDIKPANVLVSRYGEPMLADFGIARMAGGAETTAGTVTMSVAYAPPEVLAGDRPSPRSDVYSLATMLHTLVAGRAAFVREQDESFLPIYSRIVSEEPPDLRLLGVPHEMASVIEAGMAKRDAERIPSALELGRLLQSAQDSLGISRTEMVVETLGDVPPTAGGDWSTGPGIVAIPIITGPPPGPTTTGPTGNETFVLQPTPPPAPPIGPPPGGPVPPPVGPPAVPGAPGGPVPPEGPPTADPGRNRRKLLWIAAACAVVLLGVVAALAFGGGGGDDDVTSDSTSVVTEPADTVTTEATTAPTEPPPTEETTASTEPPDTTATSTEPTASTAVPGGGPIQVPVGAEALTDEQMAITVVRSGVWEIYRLDVESGDLEQISHNTGGQTKLPALSPDRRTVAYTYARESSAELWLIGTDGVENRRIMENVDVDGRAAWSPDGTEIVFVSVAANQKDLVVLNLTTGESHNLTNDAIDEGDPAWSPDGQSIVFWKTGGGGNADLWQVDVNTGELTQLTTDEGLDGDPAFNPDGSIITFSRLPEGGRWSLWQIEVESGDESQVTDGDADGADDQDPSWAPDGNRLAFESRGSRNGEEPDSADLEIYVLEGDSIQDITQNGDQLELHPGLALTDRAVEVLTPER